MPIVDSPYSWSSELKVGIDKIDEQHKKLVEEMNKLSEILSKKEELEKKKLQETIDFISSYSENHFTVEEDYMEKYGFHLKEHQKEDHEKFKQFTEDIIEEVEEKGYTEKIVEEINEYIIDWFMEHLRHEDLKFRKHLKEKGIVSREDLR